MIKITHEFPKAFYESGYAESHTDYDYCLIHRYLDTPSYAEYMRNAVKKGRTVYLDNGVYELGSAFAWKDYVKVIKELKPTYYILPDVFNATQANIDSQLEFYDKYDKEIFDAVGSLPISIPHASTLTGMELSMNTLNKYLKKEAIFAIPFGSAAFENRGYRIDSTYCPEPGYFTPEEISYTPVRQALNRKKFMSTLFKKFPDRQFHLLGCKSICEFDNWDDGRDFKKQIISIDTSLPVAMSLERIPFKGTSGMFSSKINAHYYKPTILIDKNFDVPMEQWIDEDYTMFLDENIEIFREHVNTWHEKY